MAKHFIQKAIKHPGALRATAKSEGLVHGDAPLSRTVVAKLAKSKNKKTAARARLARTLMSMHH